MDLFQPPNTEFVSRAILPSTFAQLSQSWPVKHVLCLRLLDLYVCDLGVLRVLRNMNNPIKMNCFAFASVFVLKIGLVAFDLDY